MAVDDVDEDGNPTTSAAGHSDRTGQLATDNARDLANSDRRDLARLVDQMGRSASGSASCANGTAPSTPTISASSAARQVATPESTAVVTRTGAASTATPASPTADETPIAITEAHLCGYLTDELITRNPIRILDEDGNDTGAPSHGSGDARRRATQREDA